MVKIRITVVKAFTSNEIFDGDIPADIEGQPTVCHVHKAGQEFIMDDPQRPEGVCSWAFKNIHRDALHLFMGGDFPWIGKPGVMFTSCVDGKRPVVFKLERIED